MKLLPFFLEASHLSSREDLFNFPVPNVMWMRPFPQLETDRELEGTDAHQNSTGFLAFFVAGIRMINDLFPGSKKCDKYKA